MNQKKKKKTNKKIQTFSMQFLARIAAGPPMEPK